MMFNTPRLRMQFGITRTEETSSYLHNRAVVIGEVIRGHDVIEAIGAQGDAVKHSWDEYRGSPKKRCTISDCGQLS